MQVPPGQTAVQRIGELASISGPAPRREVGAAKAAGNGANLFRGEFRALGQFRALPGFGIILRQGAV